MPTDREDLLGDRYLLGAVIGRGGMADVYRATDRLLDREVAVKVLREPAGEASERERFTLEARTLARLNHPGLVMILDAGIEAERPYLVMELVEGSTLGAVCAAGPLAPTEAARIGAQVASALAYVHAQGVIHRDVKPGNVLLGTDGQVKLADFGIARLIGDTVRHTMTGQAIGTPAYLAPEQVRGDEITPAADVYSLGLVLIEAMSGERAYPGSPVEAAMARLSAAPAIPDRWPEGWRSLLADTTSTDPAARPDASTTATRLHALASAMQVMTTVPTMPLEIPITDRWSDWLRARPAEQRWVAAAVAAIAILLAVASVAADGNPTPTAAADSTSQTPSSTPRSPKSEPNSPSSSAPQIADADQRSTPEAHPKPHPKGADKPHHKKPKKAHKKHGPQRRH